MNTNILPSEQIGVLDTINPAGYVVGATNTAWLDHKNFFTMCVLFAVGALAANGTVTLKLQQATSSAGAGAKDIAGKTVTLTKAANDDNKQAMINLRQEELDVNGGFNYVRAVMTVAGAQAGAFVTVLGLNPTRGPASDENDSDVKTIIA